MGGKQEREASERDDGASREGDGGVERCGGLSDSDDVSVFILETLAVAIFGKGTMVIPFIDF